ncbi:MAG: hypothetical protein AAGD10_18790 [Myxococcota bacterium]
MLALSLLLAAAPTSASGESVPVFGSSSAACEARTEGSRVVLSVRPGFRPEDVAEVLLSHVEGLQMIQDGRRIFLEGVDLEGLRSHLSSAQVAPSPDDIDALLAALGRDAEPIDAAREPPVVLDADEVVLTARVLSVRRQRFPLVFVEVKVLEAPEEAAVQAPRRLLVLPRVRSTRGLVDPADDRSKVNVGAWYAKPGDRVRLVLESQTEDEEVWVAALFQRREQVQPGS